METGGDAMWSYVLYGRFRMHYSIFNFYISSDQTYSQHFVFSFVVCLLRLGLFGSMFGLFILLSIVQNLINRRLFDKSQYKHNTFE